MAIQPLFQPHFSNPKSLLPQGQSEMSEGYLAGLDNPCINLCLRCGNSHEVKAPSPRGALHIPTRHPGTLSLSHHSFATEPVAGQSHKEIRRDTYF